MSAKRKTGGAVAVLGAGSSGLAMAAHLAFAGYDVRLWSRSEQTLGMLLKSRTIQCEGVLAGKAAVALATTHIAEAVADSPLILVTTPASAHSDIADLLAPHISSEVTILLNPGRTFGALEFAHRLREAGIGRLPAIAEAQTIIYTCRKTGDASVAVLSLKKHVLVSSLSPGRETAARLIAALPACLGERFAPADNMIRTSIGNVGMILHCLPTLLNAGWIESPEAEFKYYYDGITPSVAALVEKLDAERVGTSVALGFPVESVAGWFRRSYGVAGNSLFECIRNNDCYRTIDAPHSLHHRYLLEDVPCGLVPLEALGRLAGLPMRLTGLAIDLASSMLGTDFRRTGRNLERLGLTNLALADAIERLTGVPPVTRGTGRGPIGLG